jgi:hypothetical protein
MEVLIALSALSIALIGIISAIITCTQLRQVNGEKAHARNAAEQIFSSIRETGGLLEAYNRYGGGGPEETFVVRGLQNPAPNQPAGRVIVWRDKDSLENRINPPQPDPDSPLAMSQNDILLAQAAFSESFPAVMDTLPFAAGTGWDDFIDTNGNGFVDVSDDPQLFPVTVRIQWRSRTGTGTQYFSSVIGKK